MKPTVKLINGEEALKILSEQAPVGACIMQDGRFCYVNPFFSNATGYTAEELVGKDSLEIVVPEDRDVVRDNTIKMLKGEIVSPYQFRVICKDNGVIWVMATVKSIQYRGRQAVLGNYMEITGRQEIEEALRQSEERYRTLAEQSLMGLVVLQDFRVVFANNAFAEISGYSIDELRSLPPEEVQAMIHAEDQVLVWGRFRDRLAGKAAPPRDEYRGIRKDGSVCWLERRGT